MLLSVAVLLAYGASVTHGFHFDDYSIVNGPVWAAWQTRPLTYLSFAMNARIGTHPALWHLVNVLTHLLVVLLLFELLRKRVTREAALLGAAVFAVHPIQAESVAYVYSRATLFSTGFSIAACLLWTRGRRWGAVGCFALALLSKEDCATVPLVILLFEGKHIRGKFTSLGSMLALALASGVHTLLVTRSLAGSGAGFTAGISPSVYALAQGYVILRYLRLIILPYGFTIDPEINLSLALAILSWIALALLTAWAARKHKWFLAGLILLIPSSSIFPLADLAADHRMYLPMAAFAGCAGIYLARLPRAAGIIAIALLTGISSQRMMVWASDERLWTEAVERAPEQLRPRIQLARSLEPPRALQELRNAQQRYPNSTEIDEELGRVYLKQGQPALALAEFGKVLGQKPDDPHAINNRGVALLSLGQADAAKQDFERALKFAPCLREARANLGLPPCAE